MDSKDLHGNTPSLTQLGQKMKCFDNYLSMVSQTYYGLPILSNQGSRLVPKSEANSHSNGLNNGGAAPKKLL
jgi:hypothetical protein